MYNLMQMESGYKEKFQEWALIRRLQHIFVVNFSQTFQLQVIKAFLLVAACWRLVE